MNVPIKSSYLLAVQRADFSGIFITSEGIREEKAFLFCRAKTNRFLSDTKDARSIQYLEVLGDSLFSALQQAFSPTSASPRAIPFSRQSILYAFVFKGAQLFGMNDILKTSFVSHQRADLVELCTTQEIVECDRSFGRERTPA